MKGFSIVELLVVIAIVGVVSLFTIDSIVSFQNQSVVENAARSIVSQVRSAQSKSRSSELPSGTTIGTYTEAGLPVYGVKITGNTVSLVRTDTLADSTVENQVVDETLIVDSSIGLAISPLTSSVMFGRITGVTDQNYTISIQKTSTNMRNIYISSSGVITLE